MNLELLNMEHKNTPAHPIYKLLEQKILVLDGAMGTMIQRHKLTEADFRGELFGGAPLGSEGR